MRTTLDIPDDTYREVKVYAAQHGTTFRQLVLDGLALIARTSPQESPRKFVVPVIKSSHPGSLTLSDEEIDEIAYS